MAEPSPWRQDPALPGELRVALEAATPPTPLPGDVFSRVGAALARAGVPMDTPPRVVSGGKVGPSGARLSATSAKLGLAGAVALGGAWAAWAAGESEPMPQVVAPVAVVEAAAAQAPPGVASPPPALAPSRSVSSTPSERTATPAPPSRQAAARALEKRAVPAAPAQSPGGDLAEEARMLAQARSALPHSSDEAQRWLLEYGARFPKGRLRPESELVGLALELKRGELERARQRVRRLEQAAEQPAIAHRARKMLEEAAAE